MPVVGHLQVVIASEALRLYPKKGKLMKNPFLRFLQTLLISYTLLLASTAVTISQQLADPSFNATVARPAYTNKHPKVLFDEAHHNFHTAGGRYKPFLDLIASNGYRVTPNKQKFSKKTLKGYDILVIANALGAEGMGSPGADNPAFTEEECDAVRDWVRAGGSLLLITDHWPTGAAAEDLSKRFGVEMSKGGTRDESNYDKESNNRSRIVFTREKGLLTDHPITQGREATERINRVITFAGQSLRGPEGSVALLKLADTAIDRVATGSGANATQREVSASGRAQAVALTFGKGRVVVLGEAAMLTAQLTGPEKSKFGMNLPGIDNRQLALNIMHWLSKLLR